MQPNNFIPLKKTSFHTLSDIFHEMMSVVCLYHQPRIHNPLSNAAITSHHSPLPYTLFRGYFEQHSCKREIRYTPIPYNIYRAFSSRFMLQDVTGKKLT